MLVDLFLVTSFVLFIETIARLPPTFSQSFALFLHTRGGQSTGLLLCEKDLQSPVSYPQKYIQQNDSFLYHSYTL